MQVDRPTRFQDSVQFNQARGHHRQVGEQVIGSQEAAERLHHIGNSTAALNNFLIGRGRCLVPLPSVFKGFEL